MPARLVNGDVGVGVDVDAAAVPPSTEPRRRLQLVTTSSGGEMDVSSKS